ncbi:MAG: SDR family oxidoreductase [Boseongicola sp. SB0676_bin_33]|uniref:SDR family oxidoreductase n=1 Tax=Boseongicola sp. SB0664_bin_43 TaxID=2604844 RepID=A0A6B0Y0H6_9RHOB|nr:SDR family oxidoreductase [Boseongicola sp. SB0664_bin_43]MYF89695.1 SDR family oxidoreductase [Boseongicola sp. SB0676_bin_33]
MDFLGKTALVTGGTSGIGAATVRVLAEPGANVVVAGRNEGAAKELCQEISGEHRQATYVLGDVVDPAFAVSAVSVAEGRFGGLHVLVNAAGVIVRGTAERTSDDDWNWMLSVNVTGTFFMSRAAIPALRRSGGGSIVNMGSTAGLVGCPGLAAYCASKGAIVNLTRAMALDHALESIRVNVVCPGAVDTPMLISGHDVMAPDQVREAKRVSIPQRRLPGPVEIANAVVFLASDRSGHVTGTSLPVDGGFTAQ